MAVNNHEHHAHAYPISSGFPQPINLDPASLFLAKERLMAPSSAPFKGTGHESHFLSWEAQIKQRMAPYNLTPLEEIMVLKAHTANDALELVEVFHTAGGADASAAVHSIWTELRNQFGACLLYTSPSPRDRG